MKISLVGYMGSGKSSVGKLLAEQLAYSYFDLDQIIESKTQKTISETISQFGEIKFRQLEKESLQEVLNYSEDCVLSMGGGTPVYYDNMTQINEKSISVYLRMSPVELANRLYSEKESRPLIARIPDDDLPEFIAKHLFERSSFYNQANLIIDVKNKSLNELVEEISSHLQNHLQ